MTCSRSFLVPLHIISSVKHTAIFKSWSSLYQVKFHGQQNRFFSLRVIISSSSTLKYQCMHPSDRMHIYLNTKCYLSWLPRVVVNELFFGLSFLVGRKSLYQLRLNVICWKHLLLRQSLKKLTIRWVILCKKAMVC